MLAIETTEYDKGIDAARGSSKARYVKPHPTAETVTVNEVTRRILFWRMV
jgi:hypothetical protein